jgi:hypothetical protein
MRRREFITLLARQSRAALGLNIHPGLLHVLPFLGQFKTVKPRANARIRTGQIGPSAAHADSIDSILGYCSILPHRARPIDRVRRFSSRAGEAKHCSGICEKIFHNFHQLRLPRPHGGNG